MEHDVQHPVPVSSMPMFGDIHPRAGTGQHYVNAGLTESIRNAIQAGWTEKRALQASACPSCSRCMFWCSTSGYLAVRWHNGRLMHNVFADSWRCCSVKAVSAAEPDIIDTEMPSLAAADHERSERDNVHDLVQAMLRHAAMAVCQDAASTRHDPDAGIATTWLFSGHVPERIRLFRSAGRGCDGLRY